MFKAQGLPINSPSLGKGLGCFGYEMLTRLASRLLVSLNMCVCQGDHKSVDCSVESTAPKVSSK